ncbi:hypothetical protein EC988_005533, partial [Linderina pennispora]
GLLDNKLYMGDKVQITGEQAAKIQSEVSALGTKGDVGDVHVVLSSDGTTQIAVVGLGSTAQLEQHTSEIVRKAVATGIKKLAAQSVETVNVAPMPCAQSAGEGAVLGLYKFDQFKSKQGEEKTPVSVTSAASEAWQVGKVYAEAQNLARDLTNTPANYMTPTIFAERMQSELSKFANVQVNVYDKAWVEQQRMGGLLAVSAGSDEPLKFLEIIYRGAPSSDSVSLAMVGKGITFDTGGYSLKPGKSMDMMKGDMGGGATVVSAMRAIAELQLPINMVATVPLCENMINGKATKVSDVYTSRAGLTVEVMNTDAEGRIVLADALHYTVEQHKPENIIDVATLTGAMVVALGELYTGVFSASPKLWQQIEKAGKTSDEAVWRMPLHDTWDTMLKSNVADLSNIGNKSEAGSCTAAAFLRQFVNGPRLTPPKVPAEQTNDEEVPRWAHLDIAGPMETSNSTGYHSAGMTGRPTRMLIELARQLSRDPIA